MSLVRHLQQNGLTYTFPDRGSITDLEEMTLQTKLSFLKDHRDWKCMNKNEVLDEHADTWQHNGLSNLRYEEIARRPLDPSARAIKVKVDVGENCHWTDLVCGVDDTQLDTPVEQLKARYLEMQARKGQLPSAISAAAVVASSATPGGAAAGGGCSGGITSTSASTGSSGGGVCGDRMGSS
jgi:hypothetical protein